MVKFNFIMVVFWLVMAYPTIVYWKQSILWLAIMSLWANVAGHLGAWDAAKAQVAAEDNK